MPSSATGSASSENSGGANSAPVTRPRIGTGKIGVRGEGSREFAGGRLPPRPDTRTRARPLAGTAGTLAPPKEARPRRLSPVGRDHTPPQPPHGPPQIDLLGFFGTTANRRSRSKVMLWPLAVVD